MAGASLDYACRPDHAWRFEGGPVRPRLEATTPAPGPGPTRSPLQPGQLACPVSGLRDVSAPWVIRRQAYALLCSAQLTGQKDRHSVGGAREKIPLGLVALPHFLPHSCLALRSVARARGRVGIPQPALVSDPRGGGVIAWDDEEASPSWGGTLEFHHHVPLGRGGGGQDVLQPERPVASETGPYPPRLHLHADVRPDAAFTASTSVRATPSRVNAAAQLNCAKTLQTKCSPAAPTSFLSIERDDGTSGMGTMDVPSPVNRPVCQS